MFRQALVCYKNKIQTKIRNKLDSLKKIGWETSQSKEEEDIVKITGIAKNFTIKCLQNSTELFKYGGQKLVKITGFSTSESRKIGLKTAICLIYN